MTDPTVMPPVHVRESAAGRRWLAARSLRGPLLLLKFGSPVLTIATLAVIVPQEDLAAQPLGILFALGFPFTVPFLLAGAYPLVRWVPQEWTIDADGVHGRGRVSGHCRWSEIESWTITPADRLPDHAHVVFRRRPAYRHLRIHMMIPSALRDQVEAWFRTATAEPPRS